MHNQNEVIDSRKLHYLCGLLQRLICASQTEEEIKQTAEKIMDRLTMIFGNICQ
jgi:hypothetical protein